MAEASDPNLHYSDELSSELEALAAIFPSEGEFIVEQETVGDGYCCSVQLRPKDLAVGLQFSLPDTYPEKSPKVEILQGEGREPLLNDDPRLTKLLQRLYQQALESAGEPIMYALVATAGEWLEEQNLGEVQENSDSDTDTQVDRETSIQQPHSKKKPTNTENGNEEYKKKKQGKKKKEEIVDPGKKPRMKTASEVISRIQWDTQICQEDFMVGYLDRFVGVIEKPFTAFSWVDVATVDDYVTLAIPQHRIQYFKYKDRVVWDKNERLDDVFGSTGSKKTILDTVNMFSKENENTEEKEVCDVGGEEEEDIERENKLDDRNASRSPNYFFAIRITDPVVRSCIRRIQDSICDNEPRLKEACINPDHLHITLCTLRLDTQDDKTKAIDILKALQEGISSLLSPITMLRFQGLDQFSGRVLFSPPEETLALRKVSHLLQERLKDAGINLPGNRTQFNPHMTILKVRFEAMKAFEGKPIHLPLYERFSHAFIGVQPIDTIHLCSMSKSDRASLDAFYYCLASMDIQSEH